MNYLVTLLFGVLGFLQLLPQNTKVIKIIQEKNVKILKDISGVVKPSRYLFSVVLCIILIFIRVLCISLDMIRVSFSLSYFWNMYDFILKKIRFKILLFIFMFLRFYWLL